MRVKTGDDRDLSQLLFRFNSVWRYPLGGDSRPPFMPQETTIILAGGGTGGHLYPGIAVAQVLASAIPGAKPLFLCTGRAIDELILAPTGFEFHPQPIGPPRRSVGGLLKFWKSWRDTKDLVSRILKDRKPAAVL